MAGSSEKLFDEEWWAKASETEIQQEISKSDINATNDCGDLPLSLSVFFDNSNVTKTLIEAGADVNARTDSGYTSLMYAAKEGNYQTVDMLLQAGANVDLHRKGETPLLIALEYRKSTSIITTLLKAGANPNAVGDCNGFTPLSWTAIQDNLENTTALLEHGADVNLIGAKQHACAYFSHTPREYRLARAC